MYKFLSKQGTMIAFLLGLLVAGGGLMAIMGGLDGFNALPKEDQATTGIFDFAIKGAVVLVILCAAAMLIFGIRQLIMYPKGAIKVLIGLGVIIGLVFLFNSMAQVETTGKIGQMISDGQLGATTSKMISGAIATTVILAGLATLALIFSEVRNVFR